MRKSGAAAGVLWKAHSANPAPLFARHDEACTEAHIVSRYEPVRVFSRHALVHAKPEETWQAQMKRLYYIMERPDMAKVPWRGFKPKRKATTPPEVNRILARSKRELKWPARERSGTPLQKSSEVSRGGVTPPGRGRFQTGRPSSVCAEVPGV